MAINFDTVADGLTATYRRGRQLLLENWAEADAEHLHVLRRRVVEHSHQMDLIEPLWPRLGKVWAEEAQRLRNRLGACQDLAVFTGLTAPHQPQAPWRSRLAPVIEARRTRAFEDGGAAGRPAVRGKSQGVPPPHRRLVVGQACEEKIIPDNKKNTAGFPAAAFAIDHRVEHIRPWQAWQRPTLPSLET